MELLMALLVRGKTSDYSDFDLDDSIKFHLILVIVIVIIILYALIKDKFSKH